MASNGNDEPRASNSLSHNHPSAAQREENDKLFTGDKIEKTVSNETALPQSAESPNQDRRLSREWDASKVPPSQFQRPKGSIYATPSTRDGHVGGAERDQKYWDKLKEKVTYDNKLEEETSAITSTDYSIEESQIVKEKVPWWSYIWDYEPGRTQEERKFISKLDWYLITLLSLGYFIKNLDQTNIANAFVSGMKEDLQMNGNEVNLVDTSWTIGYVIGQIPSQIIITKIRPSIWVPSCELVWTMLTFCLAAARTSNQVIVIRFFVGLAESIFYPAAHTILGSWYKPSELGKRACIFHASSAAAGMFSGYLQAAVYKGLNGAHGFAGWQWLFIMDGVISAPICIAGFFLLPDLPENTRAFYLNPDDRALAKKRMNSVGRAPRKRLGRSAFERIFGPSGSVNPFSLWLKSEHYSVEKIHGVG
ncbi:hypothetical protein SLS60_010900 [Paraconiothyrium brasiliense]|uniref:Major facilitator superfamily (MFS) profile domain-containing protein n=1 Tax=Paraconiothyrium brasiliense TaxID=300254 RepID=A0ABR3QN63_9PLEO